LYQLGKIPDRANSCQVVWSVRPGSGIQIMEDRIPNSPQVGFNSSTIGLPDGKATLGVPTDTQELPLKVAVS